jgi:hypothetical protein
MFDATSQLRHRLERRRAGSVAGVRSLGPLSRALLALAAAAILTASLGIVGAPLWLSACIGALAALRVAAWRAARGRGGAMR